MTPIRQSRRVAFGLGSNLGDRLVALQRAVDVLSAEASHQVVGVSPVYETEPVGGPEQGDFLNAVLVIDSLLSPSQLLALAQRCEEEAERVRNERWGPRTLDVDLLAVGDCRSDDPSLTLPHPRVAERAFVLKPWADVDPDFAPWGTATVAELLSRITDDGVRMAAEQLRPPL
jgi:2-amino-4-hydroxy-6-hydroxymethyldihydropteridine diphosphokinase